MNQVSVGGNTIRVPVETWWYNCDKAKSQLQFRLTVDYEVTASARRVNGAPSLDLQGYEQALSLVAAHPQMQLPEENALLPNYPNPFNPETWIPYHLAEPADVTLSIYAADGKLIRTLALGHQPAGVYESKHMQRIETARTVSVNASPAVCISTRSPPEISQPPAKC